ncbi:MAG: ABC transporter ATP-binding protein [Quisquiliibacterium sp.]
MMRGSLVLEALGKQFDAGTKALEQVSLRVEPGAFVSLLGPSGCGKSTLLRIVAGLESPTQGSLRFEGDGGGMNTPALSFVFQEPTLMPWASVFDNVWLPLRLAGRSRQQCAAQIQAVLATVGLAEFSKALPHELSGGMKMRVSIARALVSQPSLLLMDEPFAALDEITRERLDDDLLTWWRDQELTALFVTHSVFEAVYLSQQIIVLSARPGRILARFQIDAPYPRGDAFRGSPQYAALCAQVAAALRAGSEAR